jgi:F420-non-reducing hydrogenase small subunit
MPCRGCFGPVEGVSDIGTKYLSALASLIDAATDEEKKKVIDGLADASGYLYRFTAASSILEKKRVASK